MKVKHLFFSMLTAAFLTSAIPTDNSPEIGRQAPQIETIEGINVVADANSEGKTKVVSFWSPKKPASRISNRNLSKVYSGDSEENVEFISICTDDNEALMKEVMSIDGVNVENAYSASQISPRVFKDYKVEKSPRAFKISPEGKILAII